MHSSLQRTRVESTDENQMSRHMQLLKWAASRNSKSHWFYMAALRTVDCLLFSSFCFLKNYLSLSTAMWPAVSSCGCALPWSTLRFCQWLWGGVMYRSISHTLMCLKIGEDPVKRRFIFSKSRGGPRYCISNKIPKWCHSCWSSDQTLSSKALCRT